jgi:hypothetical protein
MTQRLLLRGGVFGARGDQDVSRPAMALVTRELKGLLER